MNSKLIQVRELSDNLDKEIENLLFVFKKEGKSIVGMLSKKYEFSTSSFFYAYFKYILREEPEFHNYKQKLKFSELSNKHRLKIEKAYYSYIRVFDQIKNFLQNEVEDRITKNTLRFRLIYLNKINEEILNLFVVKLNSEYNLYYDILVELKEHLKNVQNTISIQLHRVYQEKHYIRVIDYKKMNKISPDKMKKGDIILLDEYEKYKEGLVRRQIKFWIKSTILHSVVYMEKKQGNYIISESSGVNRKKTAFTNLDLENGINYIVLRYRVPFSKKEEQFIEEEIIRMLNKSFSVLKMYGGALNFTLIALYKRWFPFLTYGKNIYFGQGVFCSDSVATIYKNLNKNISNNEDLGLVTPIDLFNSYNLSVIGYFEKEK